MFLVLLTSTKHVNNVHLNVLHVLVLLIHVHHVKVVLFLTQSLVNAKLIQTVNTVSISQQLINYVREYVQLAHHSKTLSVWLNVFKDLLIIDSEVVFNKVQSVVVHSLISINKEYVYQHVLLAHSPTQSQEYVKPAVQIVSHVYHLHSVPHVDQDLTLTMEFVLLDKDVPIINLNITVFAWIHAPLVHYH